jgi:HNH endonuclease
MLIRLDDEPMKDLKELFSERCVKLATPCWAWRNTSTQGYGYLSVGGVTIPAHRLSYELHIGPIPEGSEIDHLCGNRVCINPAHLEPVTRSENVQRALERRSYVSIEQRVVEALRERPHTLREWVGSLGARYSSVAAADASASRVNSPAQPVASLTLERAGP